MGNRFHGFFFFAGNFAKNVKGKFYFSLTCFYDLDIIILLWCTIMALPRCKEVFIHGKDDIPAEQPLEKTDPRFPRSYEDKSRPYCSEEKKSKRQKGIKCLI